MGLSISLTVNGVARTVSLDDPRVTLLDLLRERLDLTGTKRAATADNADCMHNPARWAADQFVSGARDQS